MKKLALIIYLIAPFILLSQQSSVLSTGSWYKLAVENTGVYKISYADLENYGIDIVNIDPRNIAIYSNPSGMLPESLDDPFYTDLQQTAIQVIGENDGIFHPEDYILFFGQSPDIWKYNDESTQYHFDKSYFSKKTCYFLTIGEEPGKRIQIEYSSELEPTNIPLHYDMLIAHESELVNPGKTGRTWLGEDFAESDSLTFILNTEMTTQYGDSNYFNAQFAVNCSEVSNMSLKVNGNLVSTFVLPVTNPNDPYIHYKMRLFEVLIPAGGTNTAITFLYNKPNDSARVWLDFFEIKLKMKKELIGSDQMSFRINEGIALGEITQFTLIHNPAEDLSIWNVTDPLNIKNIELQIESSEASYRLITNSLLEFHAFNGYSYYSPEFSEEVTNQNIHATMSPDLIIITHSNFLEQADLLAQFHEQEDNFSTEVFTVEQIYNEFSTGTQDISAIRNFIRYLRELYENKPSHVLLFGDASYDYLDRIENNSNYVPTYVTLESSNAVNSFVTDQYFGLKNLNDYDQMQVAVGRLPVSNPEQANIVVNKIQSYYSNNTFGAWKNEILSIGDDGDNNLHMNQANGIAQIIDTNNPVFNISKIYLDFYDLIQTEEGPRYPEVNTIIEEKMNQGIFYVNYSGHGGREILAHEKILSHDDIENWTNSNNLPLWVLCSGDVAHFDDPEYTSLGESIFLKENGGAIALISSSRATFASSNFQYNSRIIEIFTNAELQDNLRFGDLLMHSQEYMNDSKYVLLGDPALRIRFPEYNVMTTMLNGINVEEYFDTISPGSALDIQGQITSKDDGALQTGFTGTVYLKVFAPPYIRTTNGNQGTSIMDIMVQDSILTEGMTVVENGEFEILVQLPSYYYEEFGNIKLSWYADNGETDANGYFKELMFGGEPDAIYEESVLLEQIKVYPTIFSNNLTIETPSQDFHKLRCSLYNTAGLQVYENNLVNISGINTIELPNLNKGMYILRIDLDSGSKHYKLFRF